MGVPAQHLAKVRAVASMKRLVEEARSSRERMAQVWKTAIMYQLRRNPLLSESDEDAIDWDDASNCLGDCIDQSHCLYNHYVWLKQQLGEFTAAQMITYGGDLNYEWLMRTEAKVAYEIVTYLRAREGAILACLRYANVELLQLLRPKGMHIAQMQAFCDLSFTDAKAVPLKAAMWRFFKESQIFYALDGMRDSPLGIKRAVAWHVAQSDLLRCDSMLRRESKRKWVESLALLPDLVRTIAPGKVKLGGKGHQRMLQSISQRNITLAYWVTDEARFLMVEHLIKEKYPEGLPKLIQSNKHADDIISLLVERDCRDFLSVAKQFMAPHHTREFVAFDRPEMFAAWNPSPEFVKHIPRNWRHDPGFAGYKLIRKYAWTQESIAEAARYVIELDRADLLEELIACCHVNILDLIVCRVGFHCMEVLVQQGCRDWLLLTQDPRALLVLKAHYPAVKRPALTSSDGQEFDTKDIGDEVLLELAGHRMDSKDLAAALQIVKLDRKSLDLEAALRVLPAITTPARVAFVRELCCEQCNCVFKWTSPPSQPTEMWPCGKLGAILGGMDERHLPYWVSPSLDKFDLVCKYIACVQMDDLLGVFKRAEFVTRGSQYVDEYYELKPLVLKAKRYDLYGAFCKGYPAFHLVLQDDLSEADLRQIHHHMDKKIQQLKHECLVLALAQGMLGLARDIGGEPPAYFWLEAPGSEMGVMLSCAESIYKGEILLDELASLPRELMTHDFWAGAKHDGVARVVTRRMSAKEIWAFQAKAIHCGNLPAFKATLGRGKFWTNNVRVECQRHKRWDMIACAQELYGEGLQQYYSAGGNYVMRHPMEVEIKSERPWYLLCQITREVPSDLCVADGGVYGKEDLFSQSTYETKTGIAACPRLELLANLFEIRNSEWIFHSFPTSDLVRRDALTLEQIADPEKIPDGETYLTEAMLLECPLTGKTANTIDLSGNLLYEVGAYPFRCKSFQARQDWTPLPIVAKCNTAAHYAHIAKLTTDSRNVRKVRRLECKRLDTAAAMRSLYMKAGSLYDVSFMDLRAISLDGLVKGVAFDYALLPDLTNVTFVGCSFICALFGKMTMCTFHDCNMDMSHERMYEVGLYGDGSASQSDASDSECD